jgi:hypothetical protein
MVMALSRDIVHVVVEVMDDSATDMTENKRNHGDENHLNCGRHCPMMPQAMCQSTSCSVSVSFGSRLALFFFATSHVHSQGV